MVRYVVVNIPTTRNMRTMQTCLPDTRHKTVMSSTFNGDSLILIKYWMWMDWIIGFVKLPANLYWTTLKVNDTDCLRGQYHFGPRPHNTTGTSRKASIPFYYMMHKNQKKARALFLSSSCSKFLKISFYSVLVPIHEQIVASSIFYSYNNFQLCRSV